MNSNLKELLVTKGLVSSQDLGSAEKEAETSETSLEKVLVSKGLVKTGDIGECLSEIHNMPYLDLLERVATGPARGDLSERCARRWKAFPVDYDASANSLTIAVPDPGSAEKLSKIYSFFMESHDIRFTVAPEVEIEQAINLFFRSGRQEPEQKKAAPWPPRNEMPVASYPRVANTEKPKNTAVAMDDILASLVSAVSMLVRSHLKNDEHRLEQVAARVRHCQLMAVRNNFSIESSVKLALAAWFSGLDHDRGLIKQFACPYDVESIVFWDGSDKACCAESLVLALVRCYQDLEETSPDISRDISQVRRNLHMKWPAAAQRRDLLEAFLQVLMDEQFLDKFSDAAGILLVVDATGAVGPLIKKALARAGYKVGYVSSMDSARAFAKSSPPDIVILNIDRVENEALEYCREIKSDPAFGAPPLIALHSDKSKVRAVEYLRVGADDLITAPVDMELLYLKIEKQLAVSTGTPSGGGVSGSLTEMSFSDMLQVLSAGVRSMDIAVSRDGERGRVMLKEGNVVHAEAGALRGEQAFYELMQWREGEFSMKECSEFPEQTVTSSTMSLLMEGARLADEGAKQDVS